jgi:hypothetical protein
VQLPYISPPPAQMPGKEALDHIRRAEKCPDAQAIEQLQSAIADCVLPARLLRASMILPWPWGATRAERSAGALSPGLAGLWQFAGIHPDGTVTFGPLGPNQIGPLQFTVPRELVFSIWPFRNRSTAPAEQRCLKWLIQDLEQKGYQEVSKSERRQHAKKEYGVTIRAFNDRIWPEALKQTGLADVASQPGRKSKRKNRNTK